MRALALEGQVAPEPPRATLAAKQAAVAAVMSPLVIPAAQVSPHVTQTYVSDTPLMPDGVYTEFTFVSRIGMLRESDLDIGRRIYMDARAFKGPLVEGTIVSLSFDVRACKTIVRVRS